MARNVAAILAIAEKVHQGFARWSKMGLNARRDVLMKAADVLQAEKDAFMPR